MATLTLSTNDIRVFPSARRSNILASARYLQESTFTNIINRFCNYPAENGNPLVLNTGSFIITEPFEDIVNAKLYYDETEPFEFYIHGYYFKLAKLLHLTSAEAFSTTTSKELYAYIDLDKTLIDEDADEYRVELIGRDTLESDLVSSLYTGLKFTDTLDTTTTNRYYLHLFSRELGTEDWALSVVNTSLYRFSFSSVNIDIDGGIIV